MVSECTTSAPESTGSAFSASTSTMARLLETTHSGSYVALSSRVAPGVPGDGAGRTDGAGSRRRPWRPPDHDLAAGRGTDHLRTPRIAGLCTTRGQPHSAR